MSEVPDLEGFREAQRHLVQHMGSDVTFMFPAQVGYASAVFIDPETGTSLDPILAPSATIIPPSMVIRCTKVNRFPASEESGVGKRAGIMENSRVWLRLNEEAYPSGVVAAAAFELHGETFRIERLVYDGLGSGSPSAGVAGVDRLYIEGELTKNLSATLGAVATPSGGVVATTGAFIREDFAVVSTGDRVYNVSQAYATGTPRLYLDGMLQTSGVGQDYTEGGGTLLTFEYDPVAGQQVSVIYQLP